MMTMVSVDDSKGDLVISDPLAAVESAHLVRCINEGVDDRHMAQT